MSQLVALRGFTLERDGNVLLRGINLDIARGEKIALVGASGAGKSSLLLELYQRMRNYAALCPQQLGLVDPLSAYHNVYMGRLEQHSFLANLLNLAMPLPGAWREVAGLADEFGIAGVLRRRVATLSGGERQRVALARATYRKQPVFLGDEPVSSVDPEQGRQLLARICASHETVVAALHSPEQALHNFQRVVALRAGEVAFDGPAAQLSLEWLKDFYLGA